jgi:hypothetical protein
MTAEPERSQANANTANVRAEGSKQPRRPTGLSSDAAFGALFGFGGSGVHDRRNDWGNLAMFAAIRRASPRAHTPSNSRTIAEVA